MIQDLIRETVFRARDAHCGLPEGTKIWLGPNELMALFDETWPAMEDGSKPPTFMGCHFYEMKAPGIAVQLPKGFE